MTATQIALIVAVATVGFIVLAEFFIAHVIDIYFDTKLKYMSKVIGGLGKVLADTAKRMGGNEKD